MGLSEWWAEHKENQQVQERLKAEAAAVETALDARNRDALAAALEKIEDKDAFIKSAHYTGMLQSTILSGDDEIFLTLLALSGDPNMTLDYRYDGSRYEYGYTLRKPLLYFAIDKRCHDVAMALAKHPKTNVSQQATKNDAPIGDALSIVGSRSMKDVQRVVMERAAELLRLKAEAMIAKSQQMLDGNPQP